MNKQDAFDIEAIDLANPIDVFSQFDLVRDDFRLHYTMPDISDRFNVTDEDLKRSFIGAQRNVLKVTSLNGRQYIAKFSKFGDDQIDDIIKRHCIKELKVVYYLQKKNFDVVHLKEVFYDDFDFYQRQNKKVKYVIGIFDYRQGSLDEPEDMLVRFDEHLRFAGEWKGSQAYKKVAEFLKCMAEEGIIYGDLKPTNIVVSQGGKPYIIDFYTATLEAAGQKIRTPAFTELYMSPECADVTKSMTTASDLWSLGICLTQNAIGLDNVPEDLANGITSIFFNNNMYRMKSSFLDLICRLLEYDPNYRKAYFYFPEPKSGILTNKIVSHPWFCLDPEKCVGIGNEKVDVFTDDAYSSFKTEIEMYERNEQQRQKNRNSRPVYVIFNLLAGDRGVAGRRPRGDIQYAPKVFWVTNFRELKSYISDYVIKKNSELFKCVEIDVPKLAYQRVWDVESLQEPNADKPASELKCIMVLDQK